MKPSKWSSYTIKEHLKYLDKVKTRWPNNVAITKLYWQEQLQKTIQNEQRHTINAPKRT